MTTYFLRRYSSPEFFFFQTSPVNLTSETVELSMRRQTYRLTAKMMLKITRTYLQKAPHPSTAMMTPGCRVLWEMWKRISTRIFN